MEMGIWLQPKRIASILAIIAVSLVIISLIMGINVYLNQPKDPIIRALFTFTNVDNENSIATYFSVLLLLTSSVLTVVIARIKQITDRKYLVRWYLLAAGFFYLSMDEMLSIHEWAGKLVKGPEGTSGFFTHTWVILAMPIILVCIVIFAQLLFSLPHPIRNALLAGFAVYMFSAVVLEMVGGHFQYYNGRDTPIVRGLEHVEELGEMLGAILVIYGLLCQLKLSIRFPAVIQLHGTASFAPANRTYASQNE